MSLLCKSIGCHELPEEGEDFCHHCLDQDGNEPEDEHPPQTCPINSINHAPTVMDVFSVHDFFDIDDPSGCIHHASKLLLMSSSGAGKSKVNSILEARDVLNRWLELNGHQ